MSPTGGGPARAARFPLGTIRMRLTAWFLLAMAVLVAAGSTATYLIVRDRLHAEASSAALVLARAAAAVEEPGEAALDQLAGPGDRVWLVDTSGRVLAGTLGSSETTRAQIAATTARIHGVTATATGPRGIEAIVVRSTGGLDSTLRTLRLVLIAVGLAGLLVSAAVGWILASRALRPVDRMRREVDEISGTSLGRRLPAGPPDELGLLAAAFNRLLARAEVAAREQESFVADASHELKTPITALEGHARVVVRAIDRSDPAQARESAQIVLQQSRRLALTLSELLALAEAGGTSPEEAGPVRLDLAVAEACSEMAAHEPDRRLDVRLEETTVAADHGRLRELALILIDNAVKYSPPETEITVSVSARPPRLTVRDRGPGLSAEDAERAFDRFFRGSASARSPGSGLGLAIARAIGHRYGARVTLEPGPDGGTRAVVAFPEDAG